MLLRRLLPLAAIALCAALLPASASARPGTGEVTPVVASLVPQREVVAVRGSDGRFHLLYELMLTNSGGAPARLGRFAIVDAATGRTVRRLSVKQMVATGALHQLDRADVKTSTIPAGASRLLTLTASFASRAAVPRRLTHRFRVATANPFTGNPGRFSYDAARVRVSRRVPPVLQPPLEGQGWIASDGCCAPSGHVNATYGLNGKLQAAERFAIDWLRVDASGRMFSGDPSVLTNWFAYGATIKAMGPGIVTRAVDGLPDSAPGAMPKGLEFPQLPGNIVVIRQSDGLSQVYAHLVPGSVAVKVGDRVQAGTVLGRLGNSGASLAPHLHVHVVNGRNGATSDGFPYTLSTFSLAGRASGVEQLLAAIKGEPAFPSRDQLNPVAHHDELPLNLSIVDFPTGP